MWNQDAVNSQSGASRVPVTEAAAERRMTAWISKSVFIKGDVVSAEDLTIDGRVEGTIELGGHSLTVGAGAAVLANLKAHTVIINGAVTGNIMATERIEIREGGSVDGDIVAPRFALRDGAVVRGHIETTSKAGVGLQSD